MNDTARAAARMATSDEANSTIDDEMAVAISTSIGRAFMLPEVWTSSTGPYLGQKGCLNTWLVTEKISHDLGGSTASQNVALESSMRRRDIHLDIQYSGGYIDVKSVTDEFKTDRAEIYAEIIGSTQTRIQFLAVEGHITGTNAPNIRKVMAFGFKPLIFNWMDVWEPRLVSGGQSFPEWLLEQMFSLSEGSN